MLFASFVTRAVRRQRRARPVLEWLGPRTLLSPVGSLLPAEAFPGPVAQVTGTLGPGEQAACPITVTQDGRLTASVTAQGAGTPLLLTLSRPDGQALVSSIAAAPGATGARIVEHLAPGSYSLTVAAPDGSPATYQLDTEFVLAAPPFA